MNYIATKHTTLPDLEKSVVFNHYELGWISGIYTNHSYFGNCFMSVHSEFNNFRGWFENESILEWKY